MTILQKRGTFVGPRGPLLSTITQLSLSKLCITARSECKLTRLVGLSLGLFLPPAIAYFPQRASTDPRKLESQFQDAQGPVYFNKGL